MISWWIWKSLCFSAAIWGWQGVTSCFSVPGSMCIIVAIGWILQLLFHVREGCFAQILRSRVPKWDFVRSTAFCRCGCETRRSPPYWPPHFRAENLVTKPTWRATVKTSGCCPPTMWKQVGLQWFTCPNQWPLFDICYKNPVNRYSELLKSITLSQYRLCDP